MSRVFVRLVHFVHVVLWLVIGVLVLLALAEPAQAQNPTASSMTLPAEVRAQYRNPDGSCVQCSIGMCGSHSGVLAAAYLLESFNGQQAERGGSGPSRVAEYCDRRKIEAYNVTSNDPRKTAEWAKWAASTGRFAAIGFNPVHFQTVYGYDPQSPTPWSVCDNNSTQRIDRYTHQEFLRRHAASGPWVVILKQPAPDKPLLTEWWR